MCASSRAESRHQQFIEQVEHGGMVRRKIEAQLLEKQQRLDRLAHHDQLTGLPNRLFLSAHLPAAIEEARRKKAALAVLFIDLDRFKHVNDTHGHETGDKLLQAVSQRIKDAVRSEDIVVRMGGDEFVVVLNIVRSSNQVQETASRITSALAAPLEIDGKPLVTSRERRCQHVPTRWRRRGRTAPPLRHGDVSSQGSRPEQLPGVQPGHGPPVEGARRHRSEPARRAGIADQLDVHYQPLIDIETRRVVTWKRWCAGNIRSTATSRRPASFRSPRKPA